MSGEFVGPRDATTLDVGDGLELLDVDGRLLRRGGADGEQEGSGDEERALTLPDTGLSPAWAGIAPPRSGWEPAGASTVAV